MALGNSGRLTSSYCYSCQELAKMMDQMCRSKITMQNFASTLVHKGERAAEDGRSVFGGTAKVCAQYGWAEMRE